MERRSSAQPMMELSPSRLTFDFAADLPLCCFTVRNNSKQFTRVFRARTAARGYTLKPSGGLLQPNESITIIVRLDPRKRKDLIVAEDFHCDDEFFFDSAYADLPFVQEYEALRGQSKPRKALLQEVWKEALNGLFQSRLEATFVPPRSYEVKATKSCGGMLSSILPLKSKRLATCYKPLYIHPASGLTFNVSNSSCKGKHVSQRLVITNNSKHFMAYKFDLPSSVLQAGEMRIDPIEDIIPPGKTKHIKLSLMLQVGIGHIFGKDTLTLTSTAVLHQVLIDQLEKAKGLNRHNKTLLECTWNHASKNDLWVDTVHIQICEEGYFGGRAEPNINVQRPTKVSLLTRIAYLLRRWTPIPVNRL